MTKATRILNEYHIKELILKGNPQYENFYKEELIEFCKISKHEIDRLNNIINELEKYIHNELVLDFYNDDMPCELIINKMEKMIKKLKENNKNE